MTLRDLLMLVARLRGRKARPVALPHGALLPVAGAAEAWARLTGREPLVTREGLALSRHRMFFTSARAERELGYRYRPAEEAVRDALDWFDRYTRDRRTIAAPRQPLATT
jgi:dihydroflavonol-4-reductase